LSNERRNRCSASRSRASSPFTNVALYQSCPSVSDQSRQRRNLYHLLPAQSSALGDYLALLSQRQGGLLRLRRLPGTPGLSQPAHRRPAPPNAGRAVPPAAPALRTSGHDRGPERPSRRLHHGRVEVRLPPPRAGFPRPAPAPHAAAAGGKCWRGACPLRVSPGVAMATGSSGGHRGRVVSWPCGGRRPGPAWRASPPARPPQAPPWRGACRGTARRRPPPGYGSGSPRSCPSTR